MKRACTLLDAMADPHLFARWFRNPATWAAWRAFLKALFALPMTGDELAVYRACTGRTAPPAAPFAEAWLVCGRRAGKSFMLALIAVYLATFHDYRRHLQPGERGVVMVIARDRKQARVIFRFIRGLLLGVPMLRELMEREAATSIDLTNSVSLEVHTASYRATRGYTAIACLLDEIAYWPTDDSADPDHEIIAALRPAMATIPGARLLCASNPHARRGALWDAHRKHYGRDGDPVLIWHAPTRTMNPTINQSLIDEALADDPAKAGAEWLAEFRSDIESFVNREAVEACTRHGLFERPPQPGLKYVAFVDPSGGSSDSFTLALAHRDADSLFLDLVREVRPPFSPQSVVAEFAAILASYQINRVTGDRYAGEWPREQFRAHRIAYDPATKTKSDLYLELLPLINSRRIELLDAPRLSAQLVSLERRTARGGRDSIDHPPGAHDDVANAAAGALVAAAAAQPTLYYGTLACPVSVLGQPLRLGRQLDPRTGRPIEAPYVSPLSPLKNGCHPGKGLNTWIMRP